MKMQDTCSPFYTLLSGIVRSVLSPLEQTERNVAELVETWKFSKSSFEIHQGSISETEILHGRSHNDRCVASGGTEGKPPIGIIGPQTVLLLSQGPARCRPSSGPGRLVPMLTAMRQQAEPPSSPKPLPQIHPSTHDTPSPPQPSP